MVKNMKASAIKTFVVRLSKDSIHEIDVDCELFEDPFLEAETRAVEKEKLNKDVILRPILECWEKKNPKRKVMSNGYWVLVNAGRYDRAERLREKFKIQTDCDLATQPYHGTRKYKPE